MTQLWTPNVYGDVTAGNHTYAWNHDPGEWSQHGDIIHIEGRFFCIPGTIPMSGNIWIGGLPKPARKHTSLILSQVCGALGNLSGDSTKYTQLGGMIWPGETRIQVNMCKLDGSEDTGISGANIGGVSGFSAFMNFKYRTDS